ncbi:hypothetical protein EW146_g4368 [Bondarzewia mesenterica]|uniref:Uncharacterized protein n=1 Tax=Bondarzewia mesenterica TaxID=1095465 RepID=A0A4S4LVV6_9AGAM|nr:hypothetical protein EW146_g4368 [Bondarzewia mesenterica]
MPGLNSLHGKGGNFRVQFLISNDPDVFFCKSSPASRLPPATPRQVNESAYGDGELKVHASRADAPRQPRAEERTPLSERDPREVKFASYLASSSLRIFMCSPPPTRWPSFQLPTTYVDPPAQPPPLTRLSKLAFLSPLYSSLLLLLLILRLIYARLRRLITRSHHKSHMFIQVKWGRERLHFPLPAPDIKLGAFRATLADYTQLPPNAFKLIHAGAVMKDDNAPISAYSIRANSTILLLDSTQQPATSSHHDTSIAPKSTSTLAAREPKTEANTISQIRAELDSIQQTLEPGVDALLRELNPSSQQPLPLPQDQDQQVHVASDPTALQDSEALDREHRRLGELLLQALLRLDAIGFEGGWDAARKERKGAVKIVQNLLDRLDGGWHARTWA